MILRTMDSTGLLLMMEDGGFADGPALNMMFVWVKKGPLRGWRNGSSVQRT